VTILYDNYEHGPGLQTDWGFSCLIEGLEKTILFDTGADGGILLGNMSKLQVDPGQAEAIVLSHDHWDHTGGLAAFLGNNSQVTVFLHSSFGAPCRNSIAEANARYVEVSPGMEICKHAVSTGELGTAIGEQALALDTASGLVVVTGCAHPGVVAMVRRAKELLDKEVHLVVGGFHMTGFSDTQISQVINGLQDLGVQEVAPCHCSGDHTRQLFASAYGENFIEGGVGKRIAIAP